MFARKRDVVALHETIALLRGDIEALKLKLWESAATQLKGRIDEMELAQDAYRQAMRRELGRMWHALRQDQRSARGALSSGDDELDAWLELQKPEAKENGST